jgi:hypothetical protein
MKNLKKLSFPIFGFIAILVVLLFWTIMYYKTLNTSFIFITLWLFSIIFWILILNGKEKLFLDDCWLKFFNNEKAWKKAYKVWAILFFVLWILLLLNIFISFYVWNIIRIAMIIAVLITLLYMFKYKK